MNGSMNSQSPTERDLSRRLDREADRFFDHGGTQLDLAQVTARAGEIRRGRRMRATMVMAACVLAIATPTALVGLDDLRAHQPSPAPAAHLDRSAITLEGLDRGEEPRVAYLSGTSLHDGGAVVDLGRVAGRVTDVAALDGGYLVAARDKAGDRVATFVDDAGNPGPESFAMDGGFAVSADAEVGAFVRSNGVPVLVRAGGATWTALPKVLGGSGFDAAAVTGAGCAADVTACDVWVTSSGERPLSWVATTHGFDQTGHPSLRLVTDANDDRVAGITAVRTDSTCSAVDALDRPEPLWSTCDHRFVAFSPDGAHLLGTGSYGDGMGDSELAILDSDTGKVVLDLRTADQAVLTRMVWEDDTHVLATVFEQGRWAVLRIGADGQREYAVPPVTTTDDVESPFVLASR